VRVCRVGKRYQRGTRERFKKDRTRETSERDLRKMSERYFEKDIREI